MSKLNLFAVIGILFFIGIPLFLSWYARGWVAKYDSPKYTFDDIPSQTGKVAVVTGGNTGIGKVTVRELARKGATVILASRSIERGEAAKMDICAAIEGSHCDVQVWPLDLSSLASVDEFATRFLNEGPPSLDMLILNAGVMACPFTKTVDGVEMQFGTNHLGHFYLTKKLMPELEDSKARVVTVSSNAHEHSYSGGIRFDQLTNGNGYDMTLAYAQSKLANILFSNELARRTQLSGSGITANCLHPGFIKTDLARHIHTQIDSLGEALAFLAKLGEHWLFSAAMEADDGALTQLFVATAPELKSTTGKYFHPIAKEGVPIALSGDLQLQEKLWEESERLIETIIANHEQVMNV